MVTVSSVLPVPPVQYMVNVHTPAVIVCAGRAVHSQVVMTPPDCDWIEQAVVRVPAVWSMVEAEHGATPDPWRYRGLPAAWLIGAFVEPQTSRAIASAIAPATIQPAWRRREPELQWTGGDGGGMAGLRRISRGPSSHCRSMRSRRRWWTSSVMRPVFGVRNHGPSSFL